jgi:large subunit ribosomal protein L19
MSDQLIKEFEKEYKESVAKYPDFNSGDTVIVAVKIKEGTKERIQNFQGTVCKEEMKDLMARLSR